ncbi:MAG: rhomboid family intramembrane serine protease, partial [Corynebacterium variabile]|nr:rhomboid family intramembrane serine protease [Corynebacterium variabile]
MEFVRRFAREAPACTVLILVCVAVFCVEVVQSGSLEDPVGGYTGGSDLAWSLMMVAPDITGGHEWWRLVTSALVHLNIAHLLLNMLLVVLLGRELERAYGTRTVAASMLLCAVGGSFA